MKLLIGSVALALCLLVQSQPDAPISTSNRGASKGKCTKKSRDFFTQTRGFLNCLGDKIVVELDKVKPSRKNPRSKIAAHVKNEKKRLDGILKGAGCRVNIERTVKDVLRNDIKASAVVYNDIVDSLTTIIWEAAKAPVLSECFLDFIRERFLKYIASCSKMNIPVSKNDGLNEVPTLSADFDLKSAKKIFDYYINAFLAAYKCNKLDKTRDIAGVARKDTCACAKERYKSCIGVVRAEGCENVRKCIKSIFVNRERLFTGKQLEDKASSCWKLYKRAIADGRASKTTQLTDLVAPATKLASAFGRLSSQDKIKGAAMIQAFLDAQFSTGFCSECFGKRG